MTVSQERWQRVISCIEATGKLDLEDAIWFLECHRHAVDRGISLDEAFGLGQRGGLSMWQAEAKSRRNAHLRDLHRRFFSDLPPRQAARAMLDLAGRRKRASGGTAGEREFLMDAAILTGERIPDVNQLATIIQSEPD